MAADEINLGSAGGEAAWSSSKMLTERAAPTARPRGSHSQSHPEGGLRGLCRAPSRRDAACPSLPLASTAGWLPWCG